MSDISHSKFKFCNYDIVSDGHVVFRTTNTEIM
jgi:hypothetical protein